MLRNLFSSLTTGHQPPATSLLRVLRGSLLFNLCLLAVVSELAYLSLYLWPIDSATGNHRYIITAIVVGISYFFAIQIIRKTQDPNRSNLIVVIFIAATIFRLTLVALPPMLSDDIYRYIWDGRVQHAKVNPYLFAPTASELTPLRDAEIYPKINHAQLPTIYPPIAQAAFRLAYLIGGSSILGIKLIILIAELASCLLLVRILQRNGKPERAIIYLWCPLPILEFAFNSHIDALGIMFLLLFIDAMLLERVRWAAVALAAATMVKILPIILLPLIIRRLGIKRALEFSAVFLLVILFSYLPYYQAGGKIFGSLGAYLEHWSFNASGFSFIWWLVGSYQQAHLISYLLIIIWIGLIALFTRDLLRAVGWTFAGIYLLFPTIYPWYLGWIVPLQIWLPSRAFLWLVIILPLSYLCKVDNLAIKLIEYLPFYLLLIIDWRRMRED